MFLKRLLCNAFELISFASQVSTKKQGRIHQVTVRDMLLLYLYVSTRAAIGLPGFVAKSSRDLCPSALNFYVCVSGCASDILTRFYVYARGCLSSLVHHFSKRKLRVCIA